MTIKDSSEIACLSDNETKLDLLNNEAISATIIKLLLERPDHPVTIGVHGNWGAGKSSVLEMIEAGLDKCDGVLCLKFNGWRFQGFEDAKIALLESIVTELIKKRPFLTKTADSVKAVFHRIDWLKVAKNAGGLALTAYTGIPTLGQIQAVISTIEGTFSDPGKLANKDNIETAFQEAVSLLKPEAESKNVPEEISEFRNAFDDLLKEAKVNQLVLLIDDLDRCLPDTAIETLEAIRLFVFTSRTAFVIAADEPMIEYAVRRHFPDLPDTTGPQTYARNYLEKLIQVPFRIPALGVTETRIYVTLLLVGAELGEDDSDFGKLIAAARERLKRPWIGGALDAATIKDALGDKAGRAQNALMLSDQIGPTLANGTKGNPRQIKRFLNTLILRQRTADARGFGDDIKLPVLAKLMLAEQFQTRLFEQIASIAATSPNGICEDITLLETVVMSEEKPQDVPKPISQAKSKGDGKNASKIEVDKQVESAQLGEWLSSPTVRAWAATQPPLANVDLRPYLFVAKDRKDYFGAVSVLGHLATIAEQLLGPKILVLALEPDLKRLAVPEAAQVFELVRRRIVGNDTFDAEPDGIAGFAVLVKAHPTLQPNLLDFLEGLPLERLGLWVVSGWEGVIKDPEVVTRFDNLLQDWATQEKNKTLKVAAEGALRVRKGGR